MKPIASFIAKRNEMKESKKKTRKRNQGTNIYIIKKRIKKTNKKKWSNSTEPSLWCKYKMFYLYINHLKKRMCKLNRK